MTRRYTRVTPAAIYTGKTCGTCAGTQRYKCNYACVTCQKAKASARRVLKKDEIAAKAKAKYAEKMADPVLAEILRAQNRASQKRFYDNNRELISARHARWYQARKAANA